MSWFMRSDPIRGELAPGYLAIDGAFPRRLPSAIVALVILGAAVGSGVAVSNNGPASNQAGVASNAPPGASTASASDLSQERSPGMRGDAVLNKTKHARADTATSSPQKRRSRLIPQKAIAGLPAAATPLILPFDMAALTLPTDELQRGMAAA